MINYFRALEGRSTSASCPFMPKLLQTEPLDSKNICQKLLLLLWCLSIVRDIEVFHKCLTLFSVLGPKHYFTQTCERAARRSLRRYTSELVCSWFLVYQLKCTLTTMAIATRLRRLLRRQIPIFSFLRRLIFERRTRQFY